jgi:cytochrome P450
VAHLLLIKLYLFRQTPSRKQAYTGFTTFSGATMRARREEPTIPAWSSDQLDSPSPPEIEAPHFDDLLGAWVLSRHSDVLAAFRSSSLSPIGPNSKATSEPPDEGSLLKMRGETREALSPVQLRSWRESMTPLVHSLADSLPTDQPIDLVTKYARPSCLALAAMVTGINPHDAERLEKIAEPVSAFAAEPFDPVLRSSAKSAKVELRSCFHSGPEFLRDSGFVALAHTMPRLLANAWFALLQHPQQWSILHQEPGLTEQAIEELLRYAGLARILFRRATEDINLNGSHIRKGERIILRIVAANRDPKRFSNPDTVDVTRRGTGQLALGAGSHSCVGANLIRMAAVTISRPLLEGFARVNLTEPVEWQGGSGFRSPASLVVFLERDLVLRNPS